MNSGSGALRRAAARGLVPVILALSPVACSSVLDSESRLAKEAHVVVTGTSPVPLLLITSMEYVFVVDEAGNRTATPITADTSTITLPVDRTYAFTNTGLFLVRVANPDANQTASIRLRLLIDGKQVFDQSATMRDAALQYTFTSR